MYWYTIKTKILIVYRVVAGARSQELRWTFWMFYVRVSAARSSDILHGTTPHPGPVGRCILMSARESCQAADGAGDGILGAVEHARELVEVGGPGTSGSRCGGAMR